MERLLDQSLSEKEKLVKGRLNLNQKIQQLLKRQEKYEEDMENFQNLIDLEYEKTKKRDSKVKKLLYPEVGRFQPSPIMKIDQKKMKMTNISR